MRTAEEVWRELSAIYTNSDRPLFYRHKEASAILNQRDAEMLAEGARREREAIVAWFERQVSNDINSAAHCRSGNAGQTLRRFAQRRKADAQAISAGQHKEKPHD